MAECVNSLRCNKATPNRTLTNKQTYFWFELCNCCPSSRFKPEKDLSANRLFSLLFYKRTFSTSSTLAQRKPSDKREKWVF